MIRLDILSLRSLANRERLRSFTTRNRRKTKSKNYRACEFSEVLENRTLLSTDAVAEVAAPTATEVAALTTAEVGEWSPVLDWGVMAKHMVVLPTGNVLVWSTGQDAHVWDSSTLASFTAAPFFAGDLHCAAQTTLADGRVIVLGGVDGIPHVGTNITALFDPFTGVWTRGPDMNFERWYATATTLPDGRVLVSSGDDHNQVRVTVPEIYDPITNTWTLLPGADRNQILYPEMFVLPDGHIYEAGSKASTWLLDTDGGGSWTPGPTNSFGSVGYEESSAMYAPGKILRAGGGDPAWANAAVIDMNATTPAFHDVSPMEFARRRMNLTILADGSVMAIGGTAVADDATAAVLAGEIWDPDTEQWTTVAAMTEPRMYHSSAALLPDGRVVVGGGETNRLHAQIYSPPYLFHGTRPTITAAPNTASYGSSFQIDTPDAANITSVALIRPSAATHAFDHDQRYVPLSFQLSGGQLQVTAPPDGNTAPPGYYMMIIENGSGVPSVASWIQIDTSANQLPGAITGRVTDSTTGAGIAGATLSYTGGSATTDGNGNYSLTNVPRGEHVITVTKAGFATVTESQTVLPSQTVTLNVSMVAPGEVNGLVTSLSTGDPISGATITYNGGDVTTGVDGTYLAAGIPSGSQTLTVTAVGYEPLEQLVDVPANGSININFALAMHPASIDGEVRVMDTMTPIAGATVTYAGHTVTTDEFGFYLFDDVVPGNYTVTVSMPHFIGDSHEVIVTAGFRSTLDFDLALDIPPPVTFSPTQDTQINQALPDKNYGALTDLRLRDADLDFHSYLQFEIAGLADQVRKATLTLFATDGSNDAGSIFLVSNNLLGTDTPWTENNLTWNNAPLISGAPLSTNGLVADGTTVQFDVTRAITGNGVYSFGLLSNSTNSVLYSSSEGLNPPILTIQTFGGFPALTTTPTVLSFTENAPATPIDPGLATSDSDSENYLGATVAITTGFVKGQDVLGFVNQNGITGSYNVTSGVLTLTGASSVANYEAALRSVTYVNNSEDPITANRTITFSVNDGALSSTAGRAITVIAVDDPPTIPDSSSVLLYTENDPAIAIRPNMTTADPDNVHYVGATVSITSGFASGQDMLGYTYQNGISGSYNATTGVLTLTGTASLTFYREALRSVTYVNTSENPSTANRVVTYTVNDGTLTGGSGRTIKVMALNDAPTANNNTYSVTRGATLNANDATGTAGGTNDDSVLVNDTDPEHTSLTATLVAGPSHASSFTLNANGTFTYVHNNDSATSDSFTYRASDGPNQSNIATVTITINSASGQPPTLPPSTSALVYTENDPATAIRPGLTTSDPDSANYVGARVSIAGGFVSGQDVLGFKNQNGISGSYNAATRVLTLTGTSSVANYQAALRSVTYVNTSENPSTVNRIVTYTVNDGTLSASSSRTIKIIAVNDPPTLPPPMSALSYTENDPATAIRPGLTTSDPDNVNYVGARVSITGGFAPGQDVLGFVNQNGISGSYNSLTGVLTLTGTSSVAKYQAALRSVTYVNTSDNPSTANRTITFSVNDGNLSASSSRTVIVTAVNDAPTANSNGYSVTRGATLNANDATGTAGGTNDDSVLVNDTDPEHTSLTATLVAGPSHASSFTLNANGTFTYVHNNDSATSDTFTYRASDGPNQSNIATVTITINPGGGTSTTVSLQDGVNGYAGTIDTMINVVFPTSTFGSTATTIEANGEPDTGSLLHWELPSSLTGNIVQSASITLRVTTMTSVTYELYELLRSWTETGANWNQYAAGTAWGAPGAQQIGVDRAAAVLASFTTPTTGFVTINLNSNGIALVQKWIDTPSTNHGVTIQNYAGPNAKVAFDSSESTTAANRPKLTITYETGSQLVAASTASVISSAPADSNGTDAALTDATLARLGQEATARWLAIAPADMEDAIRTVAGSMTFAIADLPGQVLGISFERTVLIDRDAAGFGWFIDRTPGDDSEFGASHDAGPTSPAYGHMDLLSVVAHEIGHLLGYDHDSTLEVMGESLEAGERTIAVDAFFQGVGSVLDPFL